MATVVIKHRTMKGNVVYRLLPRIATIVKMINVRVLHITMETPWVLHFKESYLQWMIEINNL